MMNSRAASRRRKTAASRRRKANSRERQVRIRLGAGGGSRERTHPLKPNSLLQRGTQRRVRVGNPAVLQWLRRNSLHLGTGNLFAPNRELEGDIRELDSLIREPGLWLLS